MQMDEGKDRDNYVWNKNSLVDSKCWHVILSHKYLLEINNVNTKHKKDRQTETREAGTYTLSN